MEGNQYVHGHRVLRFVLVLLSLYLSACTHLFYHPDDHVYADIKSLPMEVKEGFLQSQDGEKIHYFDIKPGPDYKATILQFHGNAQNQTAHIFNVLWLLKFDYRLVTFDYRGYGKSTGEPNPEGLVLDGKRIMEYVCDNPQKPVFAIAQSLGGAVIVPALSKMENPCFCSIVLDSTFDSYREMGQDVLSRFFLTWPFQWPLSYLVSDEYAPRDFYKDLDMPVLVIHGDQDNVVPYRFAKRVVQGLDEGQVQLWTDHGGGHTAAFRTEGGLGQQFYEYLETQRSQCSAKKASDSSK